MRILLSILLVLLLVPGWSGRERLQLLGRDPHVDADPVVLDPRDPAVTRVGDLTWLGGVRLTSADPAFGGFSSLHVAGNRFTLLSDGGGIVRFELGRDWHIHQPKFCRTPRRAWYRLGQGRPRQRVDERRPEDGGDLGRV